MSTTRFIFSVVLISASILPHTALAAGGLPDFAVLADSGITINGGVDTTTITGDIGTYPSGSITGLGNVVLTGTDQGNDLDSQVAKEGLQAVYNTTSVATPTETFTADADLGGLTLAAGVYNDPTSFAVNGTLTLDAQGNPNARWIIQTGTSIVTGAGSQILLINSAQAANVIWQVGGSATIGTFSSFVGSICAEDNITMTSGATAVGQLLSITGGVTLDDNEIAIVGTIPEPASTSLLISGCLGLMVAVSLRCHRSSCAT